MSASINQNKLFIVTAISINSRFVNCFFTFNNNCGKNAAVVIKGIEMIIY